MNFFFQAEDGIRDLYVTGVQTCALPICAPVARRVLVPGGAIALFWNDYSVPEALQDAIDAVYARRAPGLLDEEVHYRTLGRTPWGEQLRSEERRVGKECMAKWSRDLSKA